MSNRAVCSSVKICATDLFVRELQTRIPFRYGITEMTRVPHLIIRVRAEIGGQMTEGFAADHLPPKWFTKDPASSFAADREQMLRSIRQACFLAQEIGRAASLFGWWTELFQAQKRWAQTELMPPLLAGFGVSLVERACLDGFCRASGMPLATAVRGNVLGIRLGEIHRELEGREVAEFLPRAPARELILRHTVGLGDPICESDIEPAERVEDGLPQSLEANIARYGLTHFKIKLCGEVERDRERLRRLARLFRTLDRSCVFTLDGNENYHAVAPFRQLWEELGRDPVVAEFLQGLLFVEQPLSRDVALSPATAADLLGWAERPRLIIDESDAEWESFPSALASGYIGTSHKNCKGVFKGIASAALLASRQARDPQLSLTMSAEDLCNVGPFALTQDLAVVASLGIGHVERNGHHYLAGLEQFPLAFQRAVLARHPDLFRSHSQGYPVLQVQAGTIAIGSVVEAPFGTTFAPTPAELAVYAQTS